MKRYRLPTTILLWLMSAMCVAQSVADYKDLLREAKTAADFSKNFGSMIATFHQGKLTFEDRDVSDTVKYAQVKPFSDNILPEVYGWAGTMYGDGRMHEAIVYFMESAVLYGKQGKHRAESLCYFQIALIQHKAENSRKHRSFINRPSPAPTRSIIAFG